MLFQTPIEAQFWSFAIKLWGHGWSFSNKSWWGKMSCQLMVVLGKPGKQECKCQKVLESDSFARMLWEMFVFKPESGHIWQKLVGQSTKLVGQTWKLVGQSPHQLYRKLRPCVRTQLQAIPPSLPATRVRVRMAGWVWESYSYFRRRSKGDVLFSLSTNSSHVEHTSVYVNMYMHILIKHDLPAAPA